MRIVIEKN